MGTSQVSREHFMNVKTQEDPSFPDLEFEVLTAWPHASTKGFSTESFSFPWFHSVDGTKDLFEVHYGDQVMLVVTLIVDWIKEAM